MLRSLCSCLLSKGCAGYRWNLTHFSFPFHLQHLTLNLGYNQLSLNSNSNLHARILFLRSPRSNSLSCLRAAVHPTTISTGFDPTTKEIVLWSATTSQKSMSIVPGAFTFARIIRCCVLRWTSLQLYHLVKNIAHATALFDNKRTYIQSKNYWIECRASATERCLCFRMNLKYNFIQGRSNSQNQQNYRLYLPSAELTTAACRYKAWPWTFPSLTSRSILWLW